MLFIKNFGIRAFLFVFALSGIFSGCGSSSSSTGSSGTDSSVGVSSVSELPELTDMVSTSSGSSSLSAYLSSGTPPVVAGITSGDVDPLFWNGLLATLGARVVSGSFSISNEEMDDFWKAEGACRVAQEVGYAFQNLQSTGATLCYLKNAPTASSGVSIASGGVTADELFSQTENSKVIEVQVSGEMPGEEEGEEESGPENIFIKVFGTSTTEGSSGYAIDLWFCAEGSATAKGFEQIRVNESTGAFSQISAEGSNGSFVNQFEGQLTTDSEGSFIFDPDAAQSSEMIFSDSGGDWGDFTFKAKVTRTVDDRLEALSWYLNSSEGSSNERKVYTTSAYTGSDSSDFAFSDSGFKTKWTNGNSTESYYGAVEFQDTFYSLVEEGDFYDVSLAYDFGTEAFFDGDAPEDNTGLLDTRSDYDCAVTPDIVTTMDMSDPGFQSEVVALCEQEYQDMDFCDSETVVDIRNAIFSSGGFGEPE